MGVGVDVSVGVVVADVVRCGEVYGKFCESVRMPRPVGGAVRVACVQVVG